MSGVKHTPRPWSLGERDGGYIMIDAPNHTGLASVVWQMEDDLLCGDNSPEQEANAHLIVAAPDLLEAAEEFCRRVEAGEIRSKRSYAAFKAAIARARGE